MFNPLSQPPAGSTRQAQALIDEMPKMTPEEKKLVRDDVMHACTSTALFNRCSVGISSSTIPRHEWTKAVKECCEIHRAIESMY